MLDPPPQTETGWLVAESLRHRNTLQTILAQQGVLMATVNDVATGVQGERGDLADLKTNLQVLIGKVDDLISFNQATKGQLTPADQATLDATLQGVQDARAQIAEIGQAVATEESAVDTANPPAPAPEPTPAPTPAP